MYQGLWGIWKVSQIVLDILNYDSKYYICCILIRIIFNIGLREFLLVSYLLRLSTWYPNLIPLYQLRSQSLMKSGAPKLVIQSAKIFQVLLRNIRLSYILILNLCDDRCTWTKLSLLVGSRYYIDMHYWNCAYYVISYSTKYRLLLRAVKDRNTKILYFALPDCFRFYDNLTGPR